VKVHENIEHIEYDRILFVWYPFFKNMKKLHIINIGKASYPADYLRPLGLHTVLSIKKKGKSVPLQAWTGPEGSRKLMFPDFVTTAQDGGGLSALGTGRL